MTKQSRVLLIILILTGTFNVADHFLTLHLIGLGHKETNPIMNMLLPTSYFSILKLVVIPLLLLLIWILRKHIKKTIIFVWFLFGAYAALILYFGVILIACK